MTTQTQQRKQTRKNGNHPKPNSPGSGKQAKKARNKARRQAK